MAAAPLVAKVRLSSLLNALLDFYSSDVIYHNFHIIELLDRKKLN